MITFKNTEVYGVAAALRGMRNPKQSWDKSDTDILPSEGGSENIVLGPMDTKLAQTLIKAGSDHSKFTRMIQVWVDIKAPFFWWKQFDTYTTGVTKNSTSTMVSVIKRPLDIFEDFSYKDMLTDSLVAGVGEDFMRVFEDSYIPMLNRLVENWLLETDVKKKAALERLLYRALPDDYLQLRTVNLNYHTIHRICKAREGHKLREWQDFITWARTELPYQELLV